MFDKIQLVRTPYLTLRIWLYWEFNEDNKYNLWSLVMKSDFFNFLKFASCWGGFDKREDGMVSFELPLNLLDWCKENLSRFSKNIEFNV